MAAWQASSPVTATEQEATTPKIYPHPVRRGSSALARTESLMLLTLGAAAAVGVVFGLTDIYELLKGWQHFTSLIHSLLI